jgi:hypothetical protein
MTTCSTTIRLIVFALLALALPGCGNTYDNGDKVWIDPGVRGLSGRSIGDAFGEGFEDMNLDEDLDRAIANLKPELAPIEEVLGIPVLGPEDEKRLRDTLHKQLAEKEKARKAKLARKKALEERDRRLIAEATRLISGLVAAVRAHDKDKAQGYTYRAASWQTGLRDPVAVTEAPHPPAEPVSRAGLNDLTQEETPWPTTGTSINAFLKNSAGGKTRRGVSVRSASAWSVRRDFGVKKMNGDTGGAASKAENLVG